jgi:tetratricopeptide (TPR) repeat protein
LGPVVTAAEETPFAIDPNARTPMSNIAARVQSLLDAGRWVDAVTAAIAGLTANDRRANWNALFLSQNPLPWSVWRAVRGRGEPAEGGLSDALIGLSDPGLIPAWVPERSRLLIRGSLRCLLHAVAPGSGAHREAAVAAYDAYFGPDLGERIVADVSADDGRVTPDVGTTLLMHGAGDKGSLQLSASHLAREDEPAVILPDITRFGFPDLDSEFLTAVQEAATFVHVRGWHKCGTIRWHLRTALNTAAMRRPIEGGSGWGAFVAVFRGAAQSVPLNDRVAVSVGGSPDGILVGVTGVDEKLRSAARAGIDRVVILPKGEPLPSRLPQTSDTGLPIEVVDQVTDFDRVWEHLTRPTAPNSRLRTHRLLAIAAIVALAVGLWGFAKPVDAGRDETIKVNSDLVAENSALRNKIVGLSETLNENTRDKILKGSRNRVWQHWETEGTSGSQLLAHDKLLEEEVRHALEALAMERAATDNTLNRRYQAFAEAVGAAAQARPEAVFDLTRDWAGDKPRPQPPDDALDFVAYRLRGDFLLLRGRLAEADLTYSRAMAIRPDDVTIDLPLGICLLSLDRKEDAEIALARAESAAPKGERPNWLAAAIAAGLRGEIALGLTKYAAAAAAFERAVAAVERVEKYDTEPMPRRWRACFLVSRAVAFHLGRANRDRKEVVAAYDRAASACDRVVGDDPTFASCAAELRLMILFHTPARTNGVFDARKADDRIAGVRESLSRIDGCHLTFPEAEGIGHYTLGATYYESGKYEAAVDELLAAVGSLECHGAAIDRATALLFLADSRRLLPVPDLAGARADAENAKILYDRLLAGESRPGAKGFLQKRIADAQQLIARCSP